MHEPGGDRDAKLVQQALTGEFNIAIQVVCSRTPSQIQALKMAAYRSMFGVDLDKDIGNHASNDHKKVISISLLLLSGTFFFFFFWYVGNSSTTCTYCDTSTIFFF